MNELLTANDLERSGRAMERLDAREEAEFERMLAEAQTPQERAYLVKALAAGYDVKEVGEFRDKIHGKDPDWLQRHLTPVTTAGDSMNDEGVNTSGPDEGGGDSGVDGGGDGTQTFTFQAVAAGTTKIKMSYCVLGDCPGGDDRTATGSPGNDPAYFIYTVTVR
uniref:Uncharacterized protein n=2 Tax=unclassified Streptomyces TaxID=2593676 RepID=A0AAU1I4I8_9ACTN